MELINNFSKDFTRIHYDPFHDYSHIWWTCKSVIKSTHTLLNNSSLRWNWEFHEHSSHGSFSSQPILQVFVEKSDWSWDLHLHPTIEKLAHWNCIGMLPNKLSPTKSMHSNYQVAVVQFAPCTLYTTFIYSNLNLTYKLNNYTI